MLLVPLKPYLIGQEHGRSIPFSKSSEEDDEASELDEAEEVLRVILPAHKDAALPLDPGEEAFHHPPSGVSSESAPVLRRRFAAV
jgi:hypothetical protein